MGVEVRPEPLGDGRVVVRISGELDLSTRDVVASAVRSVLHTDRSVLPRQDNGPGSCELDGGRSAGQGGGEQGKGFAYGRAPDRRTVAGQRQPPGRM